MYLFIVRTIIIIIITIIIAFMHVLECLAFIRLMGGDAYMLPTQAIAAMYSQVRFGDYVRFSPIR